MGRPLALPTADLRHVSTRPRRAKNSRGGRVALERPLAIGGGLSKIRLNPPFTASESSGTLHTMRRLAAAFARFPLIALLSFAGWNPSYAQTITSVSSVEQLRAAVEAANSSGGNRIIEIADGTYTLPDTLHIKAPGVTLIGASRDRTKVTIRGDAMSATAQVGNVIRVAGRNFTLQHVTLSRSRWHLIQIVGEEDADNAVIRDCVLRDAYEQMVKITLDINDRRVSADNGLIENCVFEYTAGIGPQYYIGGVDGHGAKNWIIRGNTFRDIKSPTSTAAEHAVHFWTDSTDIIVENNLIIDCDRGIGFGLLDPASNRGALRGVIRNNMIYSSAARKGPAADAGIILESTPGTEVYNNTVILQNGYPNAIEYRWSSTTGVKIYNNLTNAQIRQRDGGSAQLISNITDAAATSFVNLAAGDLHLTASSPAIDAGTTIASVTRDFDGQPRPQGGAYDVGADEYTAAVRPNPPTNVTVN